MPYYDEIVPILPSHLSPRDPNFGAPGLFEDMVKAAAKNWDRDHHERHFLGVSRREWIMRAMREAHRQGALSRREIATARERVGARPQGTREGAGAGEKKTGPMPFVAAAAHRLVDAAGLGLGRVRWRAGPRGVSAGWAKVREEVKGLEGMAWKVE
ncbi:MAG: hypothetical protein M1826_003658 [Phylliscum demangeonii]|nr:MAG: hypothetical protein M1826_003658 [Phylliscum demangeonii]